MRKAATLFLLCCLIPAFAQAPIPEPLIKAKTAFIYNDGTWYKTFDKFYDEFKKWGRFDLVQDIEKADIVIVLSTKAATDFAMAPIAGGSVGLSSSRYYMYIRRAKDNMPLWSDMTGGTILLSNAGKDLVKNLRERMEKK